VVAGAQAVPGSRLFLKTRQLNDPALCDAVLRRFAARGIAADRLLLEGLPRGANCFRPTNRVDIALDPFPYPAASPAWRRCGWGVGDHPPGDRFLSHVGEGIAHNTGMADWIAADDDDYVSKAVLYTKDLKRLSKQGWVCDGKCWPPRCSTPPVLPGMSRRRFGACGKNG